MVKNERDKDNLWPLERFANKQKPIVHKTFSIKSITIHECVLIKLMCDVLVVFFVL